MITTLRIAARYVLAGFWVLVVFVPGGLVSQAAAQTPSASNGSQSDEVTSFDRTGALQSEEEIWEFLVELCKEQPTDRCYKEDFYRMRNGEEVEVPAYDENTAFKSRIEVMDSLRELATNFDGSDP